MRQARLLLDSQNYVGKILDDPDITPLLLLEQPDTHAMSSSENASAGVMARCRPLMTVVAFR